MKRVCIGLVVWGGVLVLAACAVSPPAGEGQAAVIPTFTAIVIPSVESMDTAEMILLTPEPTQTSEELMQAGKTAFESEDYLGAVDVYTKATVLDPAMTEAYYMRARSFAGLGNFEQAIADFSRAIDLDPAYALAYNGRGEAYVVIARLDAALVDFNKAIELDPTLAQAYFNRAILQKGAWLPEAIILDFEVYLALNPGAENREDVLAMIAELQSNVQVIKEAAAGLPFIDDFSLALGWFGNVPAGETKIQGGNIYYDSDQFGIQVTAPQTLVWARPGRSFTDVVIEVDARKVAGSNDNVYGVICRYVSYTSFYAFIVSSDGYAGIARAYNGVLDEDAVGMESLAYTDVVNQGLGENHLKAICAKDILKFYVNGKLVAVAPGDAISYGDVGLIAGSNDQTQGTDVVFDNFEVHTAPLDP